MHTENEMKVKRTLIANLLTHEPFTENNIIVTKVSYITGDKNNICFNDKSDIVLMGDPKVDKGATKGEPMIEGKVIAGKGKEETITYERWTFSDLGKDLNYVHNLLDALE